MECIAGEGRFFCPYCIYNELRKEVRPVTDLQKATIWKRMAAWLLDTILIAVLAVGAAAAISSFMDYDATANELDAIYDQYGTQYNVDLRITQAEYNAMNVAQKGNFDAAMNALNSDEKALYLFNKVINTTLLIVTFGLLAGIMILEFAVPLLLKNGQSLGRKCFGIALVRPDGVKLNNVQLFIRVLLGKYTVCSMLPAYLLILLFHGNLRLPGLLILFGLLITQLCLLIFTQNHVGIPDQMAGTVQVDLASQKVFESTEELIAYTRRIHADRAKRQDY